MSDHQDICFNVKNPVITERLRKTNWFIIQGLILGLMLGIAIRMAWDYGIIFSLALTLRELSAALWDMLRDSAAACGDFFQFVFKSVDH